MSVHPTKPTRCVKIQHEQQNYFAEEEEEDDDLTEDWRGEEEVEVDAHSLSNFTFPVEFNIEEDSGYST